ncbi:hypothetical protein ABZ345_46605 [Lentzea sp. NPDC005914]|uniref:hypothetical protein n=1 Tax=Lentzea sp. NPDC005914 TaxID=3154572 RepID=UPI0033C60EEF
MSVEAIELVVTALTAGAAAGMKDTATAAVKDAYASLVRKVRRRLTGDEHGSAAIVDEHAADPQGRRSALVAALTEAGTADDQELLAAASELLARIDPEGAQAGKYEIDVRGS